MGQEAGAGEDVVQNFQDDSSGIWFNPAVRRLPTALERLLNSVGSILPNNNHHPIQLFGDGA